MTDEDRLARIASELVAMPPGEFTAARDARARDEGDPATSRQIRSWKKPSAAAWAVDALVRLAPGEIADALALAAELREAQDELDAKALGELNRRRRALVAGLARRAQSLAEDSGVRVSAAAREDVERTLNAAMRDARVAAAVGTGRLVRTLDASGLDPVELDGAVIGGSVGDVEPIAPRDDLAERRARREAERVRAARERESSAARRDLVQAERELQRAGERAALLADRVAGLERELDRVRTDADAAEQAHRDARVTRDEAAKAARIAESHVLDED